MTLTTRKRSNLTRDHQLNHNRDTQKLLVWTLVRERMSLLLTLKTRCGIMKTNRVTMMKRERLTMTLHNLIKMWGL